MNKNLNKNKWERWAAFALLFQCLYSKLPGTRNGSPGLAWTCFAYYEKDVAWPFHQKQLCNQRFTGCQIYLPFLCFLPELFGFAHLSLIFLLYNSYVFQILIPFSFDHTVLQHHYCNNDPVMIQSAELILNGLPPLAETVTDTAYLRNSTATL